MTAQGQTPKQAIPHIVIVAMLLVAFLPHNDYGYYQVMRWVVSGAFAYLAVGSYNRKEMSWVWVLGIASGIYNPIVPVEATREIWLLVNIAAIVLVIFNFAKSRNVLIGAKSASLSLAKTVAWFLVRLAIAALAIALAFFILDFLITRWG